MAFTVEDLQDQSKFRLIKKIEYNNLLNFVLAYLGRHSFLTSIFWSVCLFFLSTAVYIRITITGSYQYGNIFLHSILGMFIFPLVIIPIHELLHIIPYYIFGARDIRTGMDLKQYLFYASAHNFVASPAQFKVIALTPFFLISVSTFILILFLPGLWKWSLSLLLFIHATCCAGDFALLNFYLFNNGKRIYTWDDTDKKEAYYYEKL